MSNNLIVLFKQRASNLSVRVWIFTTRCFFRYSFYFYVPHAFLFCFIQRKSYRILLEFFTSEIFNQSFIHRHHPAKSLLVLKIYSQLIFTTDFFQLSEFIFLYLTFSPKRWNISQSWLTQITFQASAVNISAHKEFKYLEFNVYPVYFFVFLSCNLCFLSALIDLN